MPVITTHMRLRVGLGRTTWRVAVMQLTDWKFPAMVLGSIRLAVAHDAWSKDLIYNALIPYG